MIGRRRRAVADDVGDAVEDAAVMATATVRFRVKNLVIVRTLRDRAEYDDDRFVRLIRQEFEALAAETDMDAAQVRREISEARPRLGRARHPFDYRHVDLRNLRRRGEVLVRLAERLRQLAADDEIVHDVLSIARIDALNDITADLTRVRTPPVRNEVARQRALEALRTDLQNLFEANTESMESSVKDQRRPSGRPRREGIR